MESVSEKTVRMESLSGLVRDRFRKHSGCIARCRSECIRTV